MLNENVMKRQKNKDFYAFFFLLWLNVCVEKLHKKEGHCLHKMGKSFFLGKKEEKRKKKKQ